MRCGKNMIGAFHQPRAVIADVATLDTLPERELRAGLAEVIKHGLALDAAFVDWLEAQHGEAARARPRRADARRAPQLRAQGARSSPPTSARPGARALLNFGHTFGHAIEAGAGYGTWLHGEAVAAGMVMASELSRGSWVTCRKPTWRGCATCCGAPGCRSPGRRSPPSACWS